MQHAQWALLSGLTATAWPHPLPKLGQALGPLVFSRLSGSPAARYTALAISCRMSKGGFIGDLDSLYKLSQREPDVAHAGRPRPRVHGWEDASVSEG